MLFFGGSKDELHGSKMLAESFLNKEPYLTLKERATILSPVSEGVPFLGLMIYPNLIRIRQSNKKRSIRHLKARIEEFARGEITEEEFPQSVSSIIEHLKTGNTYRLRRDIFQEMFPRAMAARGSDRVNRGGCTLCYVESRFNSSRRFSEKIEGLAGPKVQRNKSGNPRFCEQNLRVPERSRRQLRVGIPQQEHARQSQQQPWRPPRESISA